MRYIVGIVALAVAGLLGARWFASAFDGASFIASVGVGVLLMIGTVVAWCTVELSRAKRIAVSAALSLCVIGAGLWLARSSAVTETARYVRNTPELNARWGDLPDEAAWRAYLEYVGVGSGSGGVMDYVALRAHEGVSIRELRSQERHTEGVGLYAQWLWLMVTVIGLPGLAAIYFGDEPARREAHEGEPAREHDYPSQWSEREVYINAAWNDDAKKLRAMVAEGTSVETEHVSEGTALLQAVRHNKLDATRALLELGADPFRPSTAIQSTPFHDMAAFPEMIELLKAVGDRERCDVRTSTGETPMMVAARCANRAAVDALLEMGADASATNHNGDNALHYVLLGARTHRWAEGREAYLAIARLLIERGADPLAVSRLHSTPLYNAAGSERLELVALLFDAVAARGGEPVIEDRPTPMQTAAQRGSLEIVQWLLDRGEPLDFHTALILKRDDDMRRLAEADPAVVSQRMGGGDRYGATPIGLAVERGDADVVRWLLDQGVDPQSFGTHDGVLRDAVRLKRHEIATMLLDAGADPNGRGMFDGDGNSLMHVACRNDDLEMVELLIERGAITDYATERGYKPIVFTNSPQIKALLLKRGAA